MNDTTDPAPAATHLSALDRRTSGALLAVATMVLLGYAALQIWLDFRQQRTQQLEALDTTQKRVEEAIDGMAVNVRTMAETGESLWQTELAGTVDVTPLVPYESRAPVGAPWDTLPPPAAQRLGGLFFDPLTPPDASRLHSFKAMVAGAMPIVSAQHAHDPHLQWSYFYDAGGSLSALFPHVNAAQYLAMTQSADMHDAQRKVFDADGTRPLHLAGPAANPSRQLVWTPPYIDAAGKGMMMTVLAPIHQQDSFVGVAGSDITLRQFDELLQASPIAHARLWLADDQGLVIAATHDLRHHKERVWLNDLIPQEERPTLTERSLRPNGWRLVAQLPAGDVLQSAWGRSQVILALTIASCLLIMLLLGLLRQRLVRPALQLVQFVQDLAKQPTLPIPDVPTNWRPSFEQVSRRARERKAMLEASSRKNEELELRVRERTHELITLNRALESARADAESASAAKGEFLANMSHEIRTPIHAINGITHLLSETDLDARQQDYLNEIVQANNLLLRLLDAVLDLAKIEAGKLELDQSPFELNAVLRNVQSLFASEMTRKGLQFEVHLLPDGPHHFIGDALRLTQILTNWVSNAYKFTESGGVSVSARCLAHQAEQTQLALTVQDTGIGLSPEQLARLFTPFTQADKTTPRHYGGTGLGLTITKAFVEAMGGSIQVDSALGAGTSITFEVTLTRSNSQAAPPTTLANHAMAHLAGQVNLEGKRILLAEDNMVSQRIAHELLKRLNIQVDLVTDGRQAVHQCANVPYDLILMDLLMPVMDGLEATRLIRQSGISIPIIAMTANTTAQDRDDCLHAGMNDFLAKPFSPHSLLETVQKWLAPEHPQMT